ncbi:MAG: phosphate regulon sensor protein PhoR, partial [Ketobacteraceae bacterium]|nr:phosphate regulon sensor protein PhoR [Ketobacteraceae bacterium]
MSKQWKAELNQFLLLILVAGALGWAIDLAGWTIAIVVIVYSLWLLQRLKDLVRWVDANDDSEAPEGTGVWGKLFDTLTTQKKQARQAKAEIEGILKYTRESLDAMEEAVVFTNQSGRIQWFNKSAQRMVGLRPATDINNTLTNLIRDPRFVHFFNRGEFNKSVEIPAPRNPQKTLQFGVTVFGKHYDRLLVG